MLRVVIINVLGRQHVSVLCTAHSQEYPHSLWSKSRFVGPENPEGELQALCLAMEQCLRSWEHGEWEFTDECFMMDPADRHARLTP